MFSRTKDYFIAETHEKQRAGQLVNLFQSFDYDDKNLLVLLAESSRISIASFTTVIGAPFRITSKTFI